MNSADAKNDKGAGDKGTGPTRSFDSSVTGPGSQIGPFRIEQELECDAIVVHWLNSSIRSFDFLKMNDYSTGV